MYKPYKIPAITAAPDVRMPEPQVSKFVVFLLWILGRFYYFILYGTARIFLRGDERLIDSFRRALAGESRCIFAFRHANGTEPQLLTWFFLFLLKGFAAKRGIRFARRPHALFVYGYEVARWSGGVTRFFMSHLGAMPVYHAKMDNHGMSRIYNAILEGPYPLALAPEGQVSYTMDAVPRLEPGVIRIGFTAAERLAGKGSNCPLEILPVSIHFRYGKRGKAAMERLLQKVEKLIGLPGRGGEELPFIDRLRLCREGILELNESRYRLKSDASLAWEERLNRVINAALETAERMLDIKGEGDLFSRMYRLRQICWDRIYLPGVESLEAMPRLERSLKDLRAGEAWYITRHQEMVDFCWYFRVPLPTEETALHNRIEFVQNLWDFANRTMGGAFADRKSIIPRKIIIQPAGVINLSARLPAYREDKKTAIDTAMADLEKAYQYCINEVNKAERG